MPHCVLSRAFFSAMDFAPFALVAISERDLAYANAAAVKLLGAPGDEPAMICAGSFQEACSPWLGDGLDCLDERGYWSCRVHMRDLHGDWLALSVNAFTLDLAEGVHILLLHPRRLYAPDGKLESDAIERHCLAAKELRLLMLMSEGLGDKQIAEVLGASVFAVNKDVARVIQKMNANSRTAACVYAVMNGLIC